MAGYHERFLRRASRDRRRHSSDDALLVCAMVIHAQSRGTNCRDPVCGECLFGSLTDAVNLKQLSPQQWKQLPQTISHHFHRQRSEYQTHQPRHHVDAGFAQHSCNRLGE